MRPSDVIDLRGIAQLLRVSPHTPNQWRQRSKAGLMKPPLPEPDFPELEHPAWKRQTIINWARDTNRWPPGSVARMTAHKPASATPSTPVKKAPAKTAKKPAKTAKTPVNANKVTAAKSTPPSATKSTKTTTKQARPTKKAVNPPARARQPEPEPPAKSRHRATPPPVLFQPPPEERGQQT